MAFKIVDGDNIRESFTSSGTTITLGGAVGTSRAFSAWLTSGDTFFGTARKGSEYSTGLFTYTTGSIAQTEVWVSSNSNAAVSFSSGGTGEIFHDPPARIFDNLNLRPISVTSAATFDIGAAQGARILSSGTTGPVTSLGTGKNKLRIVTWSGATLTCNTTSLILIGLANGATRVTAAGDVGVYVSDNSGNWTEVSYTYASGKIYSPVDGTAALPAFTWASDPDSGLYRIGANNIGLAVNGAKVLDIGTAGLAVTGTLGVTGALSLAGIAFANAASGYHRIYNGDASNFSFISGSTTNADPSNYYRNAVHYFQDASGATTFSNLSSSGLNVAGTLTIGSTAVATTTTDGALIVGGGVGIAGAVFAGGAVSAIGGMKTPVVLGTNVALDASSQTGLTIGQNANATVATGGGYNLISVAEVSSTGNTALFLCGNQQQVLINQTSGSSWVAGTTPGAGFSLGYSSGNYKIFNGSSVGNKLFVGVVIRIV